jgi:hypothetical protein
VSLLAARRPAEYGQVTFRLCVSESLIQLYDVETH